MKVNINSQEYEIIEEIGHGAFGKVFKIEKDKRYYAFKKIRIDALKKEEIEKYKEEAKILSEFNNEYIVKYYNSFIKDDTFNILMEYAGKFNLKQFIKNKKNELIEENIIYFLLAQKLSDKIEYDKKK